MMGVVVAQLNSVASAIMAATAGNPQLAAAMLLGSRMESGWNAGAVGDQGTSFGPFQIHLPAHPGVSSQEAENPAWAVNFMKPAYQNGVNKVPSSLWTSNPSLAAATAAFFAERPAVMYAAKTIAADWPFVQSALGGQSLAGGGGSNNPAGGTIGGTVNGGTTGGATDASLTSSVVGPIETDVSKVLNYGYMATIVGAGAAILIFGLVMLFKNAAEALPTSLPTMRKGTSSDSTTAPAESGTPDRPRPSGPGRTSEPRTGTKAGHPPRWTTVQPTTATARPGKSARIVKVIPATRALPAGSKR